MARQLDGLRSIESVERLSGGASQETYRVTAIGERGPIRLAVRRGLDVRRDEALPLSTEAGLMLAAAEMGVPSPTIHYVFQPTDGLGEGFVMDWIEGESLGSRIVRSPKLAEARTRLGFDCGRLLALIHQINVVDTGLDRLLPTVSPAELVAETWDRYKSFDTAAPMIDFAGRWLTENLPDDTDLALTHGDFRNGNLLVSPDGVEAVLDWELAHLGDPMRDLGWMCTRSWRFGVGDLPVGGFGRYEELFAGYESVTGGPVDRDHVRFWEVFGSFWWAVGCLSMVESYRMGSDPSVERPAIGRRSSECQVDCVNLLIPGPLDMPIEAPESDDQGMPRIGELLGSVEDFLAGEVTESTSGRTRFLARVAANSLAIAARDLAFGPAHRSTELAGLKALGHDSAGDSQNSDDLNRLRRSLCDQLRDGSMPLDYPGLADHLRQTVVAQVAIDQPSYHGYLTALAQSSS